MARAAHIPYVLAVTAFGKALCSTVFYGYRYTAGRVLQAAHLTQQFDKSRAT